MSFLQPLLNGGRRKGGNSKRSGRQRKHAPNVTRNEVMPRAMYPRIPTELNVKLVYNLNITAATLAGVPARNYFGLFQYLNRKPLYSNELFAIYDRARVTAVNIRYELINTGTLVPIDVILVPVPYNEAGTIGPSQAKERPRCLFKTAGLATGYSRVVVAMNYNSRREIGNSVDGDYQRWMDLSSSSSPAPTDIYEPVALLMASATDGTSAVTATITCRIEYNVQYFNLKTPALSLPLKSKNLEKTINEISEDESFEEPPSKQSKSRPRK